jgi:hypothetical protein
VKAVHVKGGSFEGGCGWGGSTVRERPKPGHDVKEEAVEVDMGKDGGLADDVHREPEVFWAGDGGMRADGCGVGYWERVGGSQEIEPGQCRGGEGRRSV